MVEQIILRQETKEDFQEVFEVNQIAFQQNNEARLVEALRKNPEVFIPELSILAIKNKKVVGHILFTKIKIKDLDGNTNESLGLAPIAVRPEFQNRGIGGKLIQKGFEVAKSLGFQSVIVLGHEHYYPKFGFLPAQNWKIKPPFEVSSNVFMAIELVKDGLKNISGTVMYPKEFEMV